LQPCCVISTSHAVRHANGQQGQNWPIGNVALGG
jgi:hypothetical protein